MEQPLHQCARTVLFTTIATLCASSALAQLTIEEVVVTAQKREVNLSDTPIAITALTSDQMSDLGIVSQQDIANFTPSMSFEETAGGGEGNRIYIRGIGRETSSTGTEPGVGVYNNGFYTSESGVLVGSVDRIERIEILRGPQGTLFGRNTTGGAINVVAKRPTEEFQNTARVRLGNYDTTSLELTSRGPITDNIGYFLHYTKFDQDSFFENVSGPDPRGVDSDYIEGQLEVDFTDNISWNFRYFSASFESETLERAKLDGYRNEPGAPSKLGEIVVNPEAFALLPVAPAEKDPFKLSSDFHGKVSVDDQQTYQSTLNLDFDWVQIRMLNGYQDYSWEGEKDFDGTFSPASYVEGIGQDEKNIQHELQFISNGDGDIDWLVGLFYFENELDQPYSLTDANNPFLIDNLSGVANPDGTFYYQTGELEVTSKAIYGNLDWRTTERLTLSLGLRYGEDEKEGYEAQQIFYDSVLDDPSCSESQFAELIAAGDPYATPAGCARYGLSITDAEDNHKADWDAFNWRLNASYEVGDSGMTYGTISTGYKPGGFRLGGMQDNPSTPENESIVDNEELTAYELGYKGTIADVFSFSTAVFYYDYRDIQVELGILDPRTGIVTSKLANAPGADVYGFEFESTWAITERLTLLGNYSYLNSEYTDDFFVSDNKTNIVRNVKGNELNRTPNNKFSLAGYYALPIGAAGNLVFTGNYTFVDDQYVTVFNDDIETIDSYEQFNARMSWQPVSGRYEIAIYGQNLTDELSYANDYSVSALDDGVRRTGRPISPRLYGLEAVVFF